MNNITLSERPEWRALREHYDEAKDLTMRALFEGDPDRASRFSMTAGDLFLDYSKNRVTEDSMKLLLALPESGQLEIEVDFSRNGSIADFAVLGDAMLLKGKKTPAP